MRLIGTGRRHHACHLKTGLFVQLSIVVGGAFTGRQLHQHLHVGPLADELAVVVRDHELDKQQRGTGARRLPDIAQDRYGVRVGPVVDDVLQYVGIAALGHRVEERPAFRSYPIRDAVLAQQFRCTLDDLG